MKSPSECSEIRQVRYEVHFGSSLLLDVAGALTHRTQNIRYAINCKRLPHQKGGPPVTAHKSALKVRLLGIGMGIVLLTSAYYRAHSAGIMSDAAKALLNSLTSEQK